MRKIAYYLFVLFFVVSFSACEKVDYVDMNITQHEEEIDVKEFVGDLKSHIVITDSKGRNINNIDIGIPFYVIDNTSGGADSRQWEITQGGETITSDQQFVRLSFGTPGEAKIKLTSVRSSDSKTVSSESSMQINNVPVTAEFITDPVETGGSINIFAGSTVAFTTTVEGSPSKFEWTLTGPVTLTSSEQNPTFTFSEAGIYDLKFSAVRESDGDQVVIEKAGFVNVEELVLNLVSAIADNNTITLEFSIPVPLEIPSEVKDEFSIVINSTKGTLNPDVLAISAIDDYTIQLTYSDKIYSDDEMLLTFKSAGHLYDASGLVTPVEFTDLDVHYSGNWVMNGGYETDAFWHQSVIADRNGFYELTTDQAAKGNRSLHMIKENNACSFASESKFNLEAGVSFVIEYDAMRADGAEGGIELRFTNTEGDDGRIDDGIGGNWKNAKSFTVGSWSHQVIEKTYTGAGHEDCYVYWLFYGSGEVWIDNVKIYVPNPRP